MEKKKKNRRAPFHDYHLPGFYLLTITTLRREKLFGDLILAGDGKPHVWFSDFGKRVYFDESKKISEVYPNVEVWRFCMMPDHIHMIVHVASEFPPKRSLGSVVRGFKTGCNNAYRALTGSDIATVFEEDYHDCILFGGKDQMKRWKAYLADNPRRLWLKRQNPDMFRTVLGHRLAGRECQLFGNPFLLNWPAQAEVVVHRAELGIFEEKKREWLKFADAGGILASAPIHPKEREVLIEALELGYRVIRIVDQPFGELYKPSGAWIDACAEARLLEVYLEHPEIDLDTGAALCEPPAPNAPIRRPICLNLNKYAARIAGL